MRSCASPGTRGPHYLNLCILTRFPGKMVAISRGGKHFMGRAMRVDIELCHKNKGRTPLRSAVFSPRYKHPVVRHLIQTELFSIFYKIQNSINVKGAKMTRSRANPPKFRRAYFHRMHKWLSFPFLYIFFRFFFYPDNFSGRMNLISEI